MVVITTFPPSEYERYGKKFIEGFNWEAPLRVYSEAQHKEWRKIPIPDDWMRDFGNLWPSMGLVGSKNGKGVFDYRLKMTPFAMKVFSVCDWRADPGDWRFWIDADVEFNKPPDERFFKAVCGDKTLISYLGRKDWDHSECGFVAYRVSHPVVRAFLDDFRRLYVSGDVFKFPQWHDSYVFDRVMDRFSAWKPFFTNLSDGVPGNHVWPETILGEYMTHHKGPERKREAYE